MAKKVLIAGASRGIGLEMAVQYAADGWDVIAGCRDVDAARSWLPAGVDLQPLDVTVANSVATLAWHLDDAPLDLLIVNAGVYGPETTAFAAPSDPEFDLVMHTNVLGAMRVLQAFMPSVSQAGGKGIVVTSKMGSKAEATSTAGVLYRTSKAALNMVAKIAANEFGTRGATVVAMHPGWVQTDMGGPEALLGVTEAVEQMRRSIADLAPHDNGRFIDYAGRELPW